MVGEQRPWIQQMEIAVNKMAKGAGLTLGSSSSSVSVLFKYKLLHGNCWALLKTWAVHFCTTLTCHKPPDYKTVNILKNPTKLCKVDQKAHRPNGSVELKQLTYCFKPRMHLLWFMFQDLAGVNYLDSFHIVLKNWGVNWKAHWIHCGWSFFYFHIIPVYDGFRWPQILEGF